MLFLFYFWMPIIHHDHIYNLIQVMANKMYWKREAFRTDFTAIARDGWCKTWGILFIFVFSLLQGKKAGLKFYLQEYGSSFGFRWSDYLLFKLLILLNFDIPMTYSLMEGIYLIQYYIKSPFILQRHLLKFVFEYLGLLLPYQFF